MAQKQVLASLLANGILEPAVFNRENNILILEEQNLRDKKQKTVTSVSGNLTCINALKDLIKTVSKNQVFTEFVDEMFLAHVDEIIVVSRSEIIFKMKCGLKLKERLI